MKYDIEIDYGSKTPVYLQIVDAIISEIIKGDLKKGEILPSIRVLAKRLKVSISTVKKAYDNLRYRGFVQANSTKGMIISNIYEIALKEEIRKELLIFEESAQRLELLGVSYEKIEEVLKPVFKEKVR